MHGHHEATMGLAGVPWPRPRAQSSSSEPHCTGAPWHRLRSQSQSRVQTAPSHNKCEMVGGVLHSRVISCCSALWSTWSAALGSVTSIPGCRWHPPGSRHGRWARQVCAPKYAHAVVERADHVPFALPPCHSTAVPQRAGALPDHLRSPVPLGRPRGGKTSGKSCLFRQSGSTPGPPRGRIF